MARSLSWRERLASCEAWLELARAAILLRTPLRACALEQRTAVAPAVAHSLRADQLEHLVNAAACHHVKPMTCLEKAVALRRMLLRRGFPAQIQFGVQKPGEALEAHAWVESPALSSGPAAGTYAVLRRPAEPK